MKEVTEEVADITLNIDTVSPHIPAEMVSLGKAVNAIHDTGEVYVDNINIDSSSIPPTFQIEGIIQP